MMTDKTLQDLKVDAHIAVLHTKVDALIEKQKELTQRVRANEKVVAAIGLLGSIALAFIGAGYFAAPAEASPQTNEWVQRMRDFRSEQDRIPIDEMLNNSLVDYVEGIKPNGCYDSTEQKKLLQLSSSVDRQGTGWGYDRCDYRSWFRPLQEGEGSDSWSGYSGEEDKKS